MNCPRTLKVAAVAATIGVGACADTSSMPTGPQLATTSLSAPTCDFVAMKASQSAYYTFGQGGPTEALIAKMKTEYTAGNFATATGTGFDILAKIAAAHTAGATVADGTPAEGSKFANDVIACMKTLSPAVTDAIDFTGALGPDGAFDVRGGATDPNTVVLSKNKQAAIAPPAGGFQGWVDTRVLFYSAPLPNAFLTEKPVGIVGYRWMTVPERHTFDVANFGYGTIGICIGQTDRDRIEEVDQTGSKVLAVADFTTLGLQCPTSSTSAASTGFFGRLAAVARSLVVPQAAYAARAGGGTGGLLGGLSELGVVDPQQVTLAVDRVRDSRTTQLIPAFEVRAAAAKGTEMAGIAVTIAVAGNSGSWNLTGTTTRLTGSDGIARFDDLRLDKPGGYIFKATSATVGFPATVIESKMFHIKM